MRKTKLLLAFILLTNIVFAQWTRINNSPSQATRIYFYSSSLGYALKEDKIYKTINGGTTWSNTATGLSSLDNINDIYFVSPDTGFISVKNNMTFSYPVSIYFTINGGATWNNLLGPFNSCELDFHISGQNDWYFYLHTNMPGADTIYHTLNGGNSWTNTSSASIVQYNQLINNLTVFKDSITPANTNLFYKSINGGATWNLLLTDNTPSSAFMDHQFLNTTDGYVLLYQYNPSIIIPSKIYKTTDGGQNWVGHNLPATCSGPQYLHFEDINTGYIISNSTTRSELFKTTDGGQTWNLDFSGNTSEYFSGSGGMSEYFKTLYVLGNNIISNRILTSIKDLKKEKTSFNLFPNPSSDQLTITNSSLEKKQNFVITDITGREIYGFRMEQSSQQTIDINFLKSGSYFLKNRESGRSILFIKE